MPETSILLEAFKNSNFQDAREILKDESNMPADLQPFKRIQLFDKLVKHKAFDLILLFTERKLIETDLYEYDTFNDTILDSILSNLKADVDDLDFLEAFLKSLTNINDAVANQTLLSYAFEKGAEVLVIKSLIDAGCDPNDVNQAEENYLHQIAANNRIEPEIAVLYLELMINEGLDVNAADIVKQTPLIIAISRNKELLIELLLESGAGCNIPDQKEETAFYHAVVHQQNLPLYLKLKEYEMPDFDLANKNGETILFQFLRRLNRPSEMALEFLTKLLEDGADLYAPATYYGKDKTPVEVVAEQSFLVFNTVLQLNLIEVNRVDQHGDSILHQVCAFDINFDQEMAKDTYRKVKLLIEKGADVNLTNNNDETPLMLASSDNLKAKTVELLLVHK